MNSFILYWGISRLTMFEVVSGEEWRDSAIHIHVSILPKPPLPSELAHNIEQFHVLYNRALLVIHFKYSSVYMTFPKSLTNSSQASLVAQTVTNLPAVQDMWIQSLHWEDPLEKEMATYSSFLAWKIPWTEEPGRRLQSMGLQRVGLDWVTNPSFLLLSNHKFIFLSLWVSLFYKFICIVSF